MSSIRHGFDALRRADDARVAGVLGVGRRWRALPPRVRLAVVAGVVVLLYLLPLWDSPPLIDTPGTDFVDVLATRVALFVLAAIGLNVVVGQAGMLDLGFVAFYAIGAYTVAVLTSAHGELSWQFAVPVALAAAMVAGVALGTPTLRLRGDYLAIVTLGFGEIIRIIAVNSNWLGGPRGVSGIAKPPSIGPLEFRLLDAKPYYWLALSLIILVVLLVRRLERSRVGRAWTAIREDEDAAELMGVPTFRFKLWAFAIGAAIGALSGSLYAGRVGFVNPDNFPFTLSVLFLAAVVLGGAGNLVGVIVGAVVIAYLPERFRGFEDKRFLAFGLALVVMMIFRPQGLIPSRRVAAEMSHAEVVPDLSGGTPGGELGEPVEPVPGVRDG